MQTAKIMARQSYGNYAQPAAQKGMLVERWETVAWIGSERTPTDPALIRGAHALRH